MKKIVIFVVTFSMMATLGGFTIWKIRENRDRSGELYEFKTEMPELTKEDVSEPSYPFGGKTAYKLLISLKGKQVVELSYITDCAIPVGNHGGYDRFFGSDGILQLHYKKR